VTITTWRPPPLVRPISIGIVRRGNALLLMAVRADDESIKGWRPLGGTIEFGERASNALKRELAEELGLAVTEPRLLTVLENLYTHHGATGHEIVFVFETHSLSPR
jgi:ADP-ribose pyrophosphatase YjhB (NUDIX family)